MEQLSPLASLASLKWGEGCPDVPFILSKIGRFQKISIPMPQMAFWVGKYLLLEIRRHGRISQVRFLEYKVAIIVDFYSS